MSTNTRNTPYISGRLTNGLSRRAGYANTTERREERRIGERTDTRPVSREAVRTTRILPKR